MSDGPLSFQRVEDFEVTLKDCVATRLYVSVGPDFWQFKRHIGKIAWETAVWVAEIPDYPASLDLLVFSPIAETVDSAFLDDQLDQVLIGVSGWWGNGKVTVLQMVGAEVAKLNGGGSKIPIDTSYRKVRSTVRLVPPIGLMLGSSYPLECRS